MQIRRQLKSNRGLRRERLRPADILLSDGTRLSAVEHAKHAQHLARRTHEGDGQKLANLELIDEFDVCPGNGSRILGEEDLLLSERTGGNTIGKYDFYLGRAVIFNAPPHA